jgi:uncharacterized protein YggE
MVDTRRKTMSQSKVTLSFVVAGLIGLAVGARAEDSGSPFKNRRTISVQAQGKVQAIPDLATIRAEVTEEGKTLDPLSAEVRKRMASIMDRVKKEGIAEKDLQTEIFQIEPTYEQDKRGNPHRSGYRVTNRLAIRVHDLKRLGKLLSVVTEAGANSVLGPDFEISDPAQVERQALAKGMEEAKGKAQVLAQSAGATLGQVLSIQQNSAMGWPGPRPMMAMRAMAADAAESTPVAAGEQSFITNLNVVYALQ